MQNIEMTLHKQQKEKHPYLESESLQHLSDWQ